MSQSPKYGVPQQLAPYYIPEPLGHAVTNRNGSSFAHATSSWASRAAAGCTPSNSSSSAHTDDSWRSSAPGKRRKRDHKVAEGFPCTHDGCDKVFDREADRRKHSKSHLSEAERPYACGVCPRRFLFPKDVRRHQESIHSIQDTRESSMSAQRAGGQSIVANSEWRQCSQPVVTLTTETEPRQIAHRSTPAKNVSMQDHIDPSFSLFPAGLDKHTSTASPRASDAEMATSDRRYSYAPLDSSAAKQIRLLQLLPATFEDEAVQCTLTRHQVGDVPYEALSYAWGDADARTIYVDSCSMQVRPNLHSALRRLRKQDEPRYLWIDALCINQDDSNEKASQIQLMSIIYSSAHTVCVWLGEHCDDSERAIGLISSVENVFEPKYFDDDHYDAREWLALTGLLSRSWFCRLWVVQEISLAQQATVYCGDTEITWASFETAVALWQTNIPKWKHRPELFSKWEHRPELFTEVEQWAAGRLMRVKNEWCRFSPEGRVCELSLPLADLMSATWFLECSDPHDRVYALLALAKDSREVQERYHLEWPIQATLAPVDHTTRVGAFVEPSAVRHGTLVPLGRPRPHKASALPPTHLGLLRSASRHYTLSLEDQQHEFAIRPDASQDIAEILKQVIRLVARDESPGNLDILCRPWAPSFELSECALPSWVADWNCLPFCLVRDPGTPGGYQQKRKNADPLVGLTAQNGPRYNACRSMVANFGRDWGFVEDEEMHTEIMTPLHYASLRGRDDIVKMLLDSGADPNAQVTDEHAWASVKDGHCVIKGRTPLDFASRAGRPDITSLLLQAGAKPNSAEANHASSNAQAWDCPEQRLRPFTQQRGHDGPQNALYVTGFVLDVIEDLLEFSQRGTVPEEWLALGGLDKTATTVPDPLWRTLVADRSLDGSYPRAWYGKAFEYVVKNRVDGIDVAEHKARAPPIVKELCAQMESAIWNRRLFRSRYYQRLGLSPKASRLGDVVCILVGCSVPVILRPTGDEHCYTFIGECYMDGMMDGAAVITREIKVRGCEGKVGDGLTALQTQRFVLV